MATLKTTRTNASVNAFLGGIADRARRQDCLTVLRIMRKATKAVRRRWGSHHESRP